MPNRLRTLFLACAALCLLAPVIGCGYAFSPQGEHLDPGIRAIYVEPFGNKTAQAELENVMRTAFIDQVLQYSRFKTVSGIEQADAVISGQVLNFSTSALAYRKDILAAQERAAVTLDLSFRETRTGKTLWSSRSVTGTVDYTLDDDINLLPSTRKSALAKLSRDTAARALNLMMSNF